MEGQWYEIWSDPLVTRFLGKRTFLAVVPEEDLHGSKCRERAKHNVREGLAGINTLKEMV